LTRGPRQAPRFKVTGQHCAEKMNWNGALDHRSPHPVTAQAKPKRTSCTRNVG
jgi:hypothetical protein